MDVRPELINRASIAPVRINELKRLISRDSRRQRWFCSVRTGFLMLWKETEDAKFTYLITAKHVVVAMTATGRPMVCRLNSRTGDA